MTKKILLTAVVMTVLTQTIFAYNVVGHRIVADIAYRHLTENARKKIDKVLGKRGIIYTSSWADEIKDDETYKYSYSWHFQNLKPNMNKSELQKLANPSDSTGENLFSAIQNMKSRLQKNKQDQEALKFLVHLVGDLHQPLHLGHKEDLGGNKIETKWFGQKTNIHRIWDGMLIDSRKMSSSEYAQYLEDKFEEQKVEIRKYTLFDSIEASYLLSSAIYAYDLSDTNSYHYIRTFINDVDTMLYRGGIQLAKILNAIYK